MHYDLGMTNPDVSQGPSPSHTTEPVSSSDSGNLAIRVAVILLALAIIVQVVKLTSDPSADGGGDVIILTTSWCGYCKQARTLLRQQGVRYTEYDVETSRTGRQMFDAYRGRSVPLILVGNQVIRGYDRAAILAALERRTPAALPRTEVR